MMEIKTYESGKVNIIGDDGNYAAPNEVRKAIGTE